MSARPAPGDKTGARELAAAPTPTPPLSTQLSTQLSSFSLFLFTYYAHLGTFATYASLFFAARGMSAPQVGVLMSLIQVMRIFGPNLWGWVADHTRRRVLVLRITAVAAIASFAGIFLGHSFVQFFAAMVLLNLFTSAQGPLTEALMLAEMKGDMSQYGRVRMWGSLGFIAAVLAAGYGLEWFGVEALPWLAGGLLVLVLGAALRIREAPPGMHHGAAPSVLHLLRQKAVIAFFAQAALMVAAHTSLYVFYSLYLERNGYSKPVIGAMWSLGVFAEVMFFYFQASVLRRVSADALMLGAFAVAVLRFAMIGAGAQWLAVLVLAQLLHCLTFAAHHSASIMTMQRWFAGPLQARGQALFMSIAYGIGGTFGGLFMSWCWEQFGSHAVYFAAIGLAVAGAVTAMLAKRWREAG
jgi:PPP family 3-phenylpropionic acid transporter